MLSTIVIGVAAAPAITISVSPAAAVLTPSGTLTIAATVAGTSNSAVSWSLTPALGTISAAGLYTAPAAISSRQNVTVTATSVADPTKSAAMTLTLSPPIVVTLTPATATLTQSKVWGFSASVANTYGTENTGVTWSLSPAVGTITQTGVYTAPAVISNAQTVKVTATSIADPTKYAAASVILTPPVAVSVTPATVSLTPSQSQRFSPTVLNASNTLVTWSINPAVGSISSAGLYTAPATTSGIQTITVKATSAVDATKSATATVTLNPPVAVSLAPAAAALTQSQQLSFAVSVSNAANAGVTWSLSPQVGTISATGIYTAPSSISGTQTVKV